MADAPRLNSATDSAAKYAPLSGWAVASAAVAAVFVGLLVIFGWRAWAAGEPLLNPLLFVLAGVGAVLALLGWRHVRTSEGARTGAGYATFGGWTCLVVGACYLAYWLATDFAVKAEAEKVAGEWGARLLKGNPADPDDPAVRSAFVDVLDPGQQNLNKNPKVLFTALGIPFAQFRNSALVQLPARYRDAPDPKDRPKFTVLGLREWQTTPDGKLSCMVTATLTCPEGDFPVGVPLVGSRPKDQPNAARAWQVGLGPGSKFLDPDKGSRTRYGWLMVALEEAATNTAGQFCQLLATPPPLGQLMAADELGARGGEGRFGLLGGAGVLAGPTAPPAGFFARPGGQPMTDDPFARPDGESKPGGLTRLRGVWYRTDPFVAEFKLAGRGGFLQAEQAAANPVFDLSDPARIRVRMPVEFRPPPQGNPKDDEFYGSSNKTFAVGWLVMELTDPAAVKQFADARATRGPTSTERPSPADLGVGKLVLRVVRLESDLMPVVPPQAPSGPGGAPPTGPGG